MERAFRDKTSWYDGWLYEKIMDSMAGELFVTPISEFVEDGSAVIDIGCGIGSLALALSQKCTKVTGIDVSSRMIAHAQKRKRNKRCSNIEFRHLCASLLPEAISDTFDYAVMSQILHEVSEELRVATLEAVKNVTGRLIIADYVSPLPKGRYGRMIRFVERLAGSGHNRNFRDWQARGGLDGFVSRHELRVEQSRLYMLGGQEIGIGKIVKASY